MASSEPVSQANSNGDGSLIIAVSKLLDDSVGTAFKTVPFDFFILGGEVRSKILGARGAIGSELPRLPRI